jgi:hypothetical protein
MSQETHILDNEEKEKWIEYYVEREIAISRMRVQDPKPVIMENLKDMVTADSGGVTTRQTKTTCEEMLNVIRDSGSIHYSSDNEQNGEVKHDGEYDT